MASWDSPQQRFEPDWTLDSKIQQAATEARRQQYAFAQAKGLNDAWSSSLDEAGRPNEVAFYAQAKRLGLGPAATRQYWQEQTQQYADAANQAQNAMMAKMYGADPSLIKGPAPMPTVRAAQPLDSLFAPQAPAASSATAGGATTLPAQAQDGNTVVVPGAVNAAPTGGVYQLPAPEQQEYAPPPREGVATEFARSINPTALLGGVFDTGVGEAVGAGGAATRDVSKMAPVAQDVLRTQLERSFATNGGDLQGAFDELVATRRGALVKPNPSQFIVFQNGRPAGVDVGAYQKAMAEYVAKYSNAPNEVIAALPDQYKEQLSQALSSQAQRNANVEARNKVVTENRPYAAAMTQAAELDRGLSGDPNPEYAKVRIDPSLFSDDPKKAADLRARYLVRGKLLDQIGDVAKAATPTEKYTEAQKLINGIQQIEKMPNVESVHSQLLFSLMPNLTMPEAIRYGYIKQDGGVFSMAPGLLKTLITKTPPEEIVGAFTKMVRDSPILLADLENASSVSPSAIPMVQAPSYADLPKIPGATTAPAPAKQEKRAPLDLLFAPREPAQKPAARPQRQAAPAGDLPPVSMVRKQGVTRLTDPSGKVRSFKRENGRVVEVR